MDFAGNPRTQRNCVAVANGRDRDATSSRERARDHPSLFIWIGDLDGQLQHHCREFSWREAVLALDGRLETAFSRYTENADHIGSSDTCSI